MAKLVEIIGVTHNPFLPGLIARNAEPTVAAAAEDYKGMQAKMVQAKPDVLIVVASDHLNQWFTDNMPPFIVGKAPAAEGPFPWEARNFGLAPYKTPVDMDLARSLVRDGFRHGVDFAFSDEFMIDHAFTVPLNFIRPQMDLPIVPVWTNVMAPPVPPAERFYAVGRALREIVDALPGNQRIGVVSSGHLAVEVGGPKASTYSADTEFDRRMMSLIKEGDAATVIKESTWERLYQAGNVAAGFLNYVLLMGIGGKAPSATGLRFPDSTAAVNYMAWDLHHGGGQ
jgi:protocatechuate 4,5-dioxygenase beta chain